MPKIPKDVKKQLKGKPFTLIIGKNGEPSCIMCEKNLGKESHFTAVWVWEEHKRNYVYSICDMCRPKYSMEEIEEKIILTLAICPRFKAVKK